MKQKLTLKSKTLKWLLMIPLLVGVQNGILAQTMLTGWNGTTTSTATYPRASSAVDVNSGLTTSDAVENYSGLGLSTDLRTVYTVPQNGALNINSTPFLSYTLSFSSLKSVDFDRFVLHHTASLQTFQMQLRWSVDNFSSNLGQFAQSGGYGRTSVNLNPLSNFVGTQIEFRIYFYNATGQFGGLVYTPSYSSSNHTDKDGTPISYVQGASRSISIWSNSVNDVLPDLNIVSTGGVTEGNGWSYSNGVITPNAATPVNINASDIVSKLNQGNLTVQTTGSLTISSNITSTNSNALTFKAARNILQNSGADIVTNGGNVVLWSDSDNNGQGAIVIGTSTGTGESIRTSGGNITLSGGADIATGYAKAAVGFLPWTAKPITGISIFNATLVASNNNNPSASGNILVRGSISNTVGAVSGRAVLLTNSGLETQGTGTITIDGACTNFAGSNPWGVIIEGYSYVETDNGSINIIGDGSTAAANARGIAIAGTVTDRPAIQSVSGNITLTDRTTNTSSANYTGIFLSRPLIGAGFNDTSTSNIIINTDKIYLDSDGGNTNINGTNIDEQTQFITTGNVTIQSNGNSFTAIPEFNRTHFSPTINTLTLGKSTNTSRIVVGNHNGNTGAGATLRRMGLNLSGTLVINAKDIDFTINFNVNKLITNINNGGHVQFWQKSIVNEYRGYGLDCTISGTNNDNEFSMIRLGVSNTPIKWVNIRNNITLTLGDDSFGIYAKELINFWTFNGDILINRTLKSDLNTLSGLAIQLASGVSIGPKGACDSSIGGPNVKFLRSSAQLIYKPNARVFLFSSNPSLSSGLPQLNSFVYYRTSPTNNQAITGTPGIHLCYRADQEYPISSPSIISGESALAATTTTATYSINAVNGATSYI
ncbi:hypothetical protein, partial [Flavobacterium cheonanense]|uniref:hypothetical protein n=1 Tax=Flavobacterium cheonanense TaxID=706183 RepID=UPI0031DDD963